MTIERQHDASAVDAAGWAECNDQGAAGRWAVIVEASLSLAAQARELAVKSREFARRATGRARWCESRARDLQTA